MAIVNLRGERITSQHTYSEDELLASIGKTENDKMNAEAFGIGISRYWPAPHTEELARQVGKFLKRQIKNENVLNEDERNALHQAILEEITHSATRSTIQQSRVFASALDSSVTWEHAWSDLTHRQQRRRSKLAREAVALHAKLVGGKSGNNRCSPAARIERREQKRKQEEFLATRSAFDKETGKYFGLTPQKDKQRARLAEMYVMVKGLEVIINQNDGQKPKYEWARAIITVPAHMHANPTKGQNSWDGTLPSEAAKYLARGWGKVRSRLAKFGITCSGFWTREAHLDGTPHVNFFIIFTPGAYREVARAIKEVFGKNKRATDIEKGDDPRALEARKKAGKQSASFASYAALYFMKQFSENPGEGAEGEDVTASSFAYRRYGFFGLPGLTVWRELRRLRSCNNSDPLIKSAWLAAHRGDTATFIQLAGGLACARAQRPLQTLRRVAFKNKIVQVVTDEPAETPFDQETETITTETSEVIGIEKFDLEEVIEGEIRFNGWKIDAEQSRVRTEKHREAHPNSRRSKLVYARSYKIALTKKIKRKNSVKIQTRQPGLYEIIPTEEAVARAKAVQETREDRIKKLKDYLQSVEDGPLVTVILNYPREEAAPPPTTQKPPPCTEREYRLAAG